MKTKYLLVAFLLTALLSLSAFADIPPPKDGSKKATKTRSIDTYLSIRIDKSATQAKLLIPASQLKQFRAELEGIEDDSTAATAGISGTQTIASALMISFALVLGGVWFSRNRSARSGAAAAALVVFATCGFAAIVYGNAGPPSEARSITGKMFSPSMHLYKSGGGKIKLEISTEVENPILVVPDPQEQKPLDE